MAVALGSHITFWDDLTDLDRRPDRRRPGAGSTSTRRTATACRPSPIPLLDDPAGGQTWTALQPWDLDTRSGMLLVYRQDNDADSRSVPLRGLREGSRYVVRDVRSGA